MDPRLGLDAGLYTMDQAGAGQPLLRSSGGFTTHPHSQMLVSAAAGAMQPHHGFGGYMDRDIGRQDISGLSQYTPPPVHSLSTGQGYYTVESLEGRAVTQADVLGSRSSLMLQEGERNVGLGQQGFENSMLPSAMQNGLGQKVPSSAPPFGVVGSAPYLGSHLQQDMDVGRGGLIHVDSGGAPYLHHAQSGFMPGRASYEQLAPQLASLGPARAGPQEWELRRRNELVLAALEQRRDLEHEARIREAQHEARIREARIREARIEHEARIRDARIAFIQERALESRGRLPSVSRHQGLSSRSKRTGHGPNSTWCSVCQIECHTSFNLKSHFGGKRHKLKLDEEAEKKTDKSVEKEESIRTEDDIIDGKRESTKSEVNGVEKIQPIDGEGEDEINESDGVSEVPNLGKRSFPDDTETGLAHPNKKVKNKESGPKGANSDGFVERASGPRKKMEKCETCNVTCFGKVDLHAHLRGKRHAAQLKKLQDEAGGDTEKANQVDSKPVEEGANNKVGLSVLCSQAERMKKTNS
ncbi:hypothetical protein O6H91_16G009300 [Diphasiastrum complanatum]|uniref:Uncharacterized protein n=1 Tax=Diphasiastrum complanatum TaxID=34168 RepID=A0ACC2BAS0_DIPCM|nr:hypothetical protein O6H91_16G009300 [Diphasiastrum complanatum]